MSEGEDRLDELLRAAFTEGLIEPLYKADSAETETVPAELVDSVLARAREESSRLLAAQMVKAAERVGWSMEDLAYEAVGEEKEAQQFLVRAGDPRQLSPHSMARLLWRSRLRLSVWKELLGQAVASYVVFRRPLDAEMVWGRTTGLSGEERADALMGAQVEHDPIRARHVAEEFVEEVEEAWKSLIMKAGGGPGPTG